MKNSLRIHSLFKQHQEIVEAGGVVLVCFVVLFFNLGGAALIEPDEGRNAEVAREVLLLKDWVTPHYDFIPYLDKPMFFYWIVAAAYKMFGVSEFAARLPSALAALGCVLLIYDLTRRSCGRSSELWSSLVLVTSPAFVAFSHATIFDMLLTFFITLALWSFDRAESSSGYRKTILYLVMYAAVGCATLVKGPIGVVIPAMIIGCYVLWTRQWFILREVRPLTGIAMFLAIVVPWYAWAESRNPGYLRYFLFEEHFLRYLTSYFRRQEPWYYYAQVLAVGFFPWTALIPFVRPEIKSKRVILLFLWTVVPLLFFSFSESKQPGYVLPIFPPLSILVGDAIDRRLAVNGTGRRWPLSIAWFIILPVFCYFSLALFLPTLFPAGLIDRYPEVLVMIQHKAWMLLPIVGLLLVCAGASLIAKPVTYFIACCLFLSALHLFGLTVVDSISESRSSRKLAAEALPFIRSGDKIVIYSEQLSSLPFYLRAKEPIVLVVPDQKKAVMGSVYIATKNPPPSTGDSPVVLSFKQFSELWDNASFRLLVFANQKRIAAFNKRVSTPAKTLLTVGDLALLTNQ